jgi:hypothetical protein
MNLKPGWVDEYTAEIRAAGTYAQRVRRADPELDAVRPKFRDKPPPALWGMGTGGKSERNSGKRGAHAAGASRRFKLALPDTDE